MKKSDYVNLIKKEIDWCKENRSLYSGVEHCYVNPAHEFHEGFIKGLEQAVLLITGKAKVKKCNKE